jgi:hypothetical protein
VGFLLLCVWFLELVSFCFDLRTQPLIPLMFSFGTIDRVWVPASYSIAFLLSQELDWLSCVGD